MFLPRPTLRAIIVALTITLLLVAPVREASDVIAAIAATMLLLAIVFSALALAIRGNRVRRSFTCSLHVPGSPLSLRSVPLAVHLAPYALPLGSRLAISGTWRYGNSAPLTFTLTGAAPYPRTVSVPYRFPHRGRWQIEQLSFTLSDVFGLWRLRWYSELPTELTIESGISTTSPVPPLSSRSRPGDLIADVQEPRGDLYDLKRHQPSDGARAIVWKIFARQRVLMTRQPERSASPEGEAAIIMVSGDDDLSWAAVLEYVERLDDAEIVPTLLTLHERLPIARGVAACHELALSSAPGTVDIMADLLPRAVARFEERDPVAQVILFIAARDLTQEIATRVHHLKTAHRMITVVVVGGASPRVSPRHSLLRSLARLPDEHLQMEPVPLDVRLVRLLESHGISVFEQRIDPDHERAPYDRGTLPLSPHTFIPGVSPKGASAVAYSGQSL